MRTADTSDAARRLYEAGSWVYAQVEHVRSQLAQVDVGQDTASSLRLYAGVLNRSWRLADVTTTERFAQKPGPISLDLIKPFAEAIEGLEEGARYPIALALDARPTTRHSRLPSAETVSAIKYRLTLGSVYDTIEVVWDNCLWLDWESKQTTFLPLVLVSLQAAAQESAAQR